MERNVVTEMLLQSKFESPSCITIDTFVVRSDNLCISLLPLIFQTPFHHPDQ